MNYRTQDPIDPIEEPIPQPIPDPAPEPSPVPGSPETPLPAKTV